MATELPSGAVAREEKLEPTPEQWEAIRVTGEHLLVKAGAGTGKTFTVVHKILYLLGVEVCGETIERPLRLSDIAAITFTNQAAAELKEKLRAGLRRAGRRDLAYEVDLARVGTIHSFCGELLRDFALRTGRAPAGRILEEGEASALTAEVVRDALVEALETGEAPGLAELLSSWNARDVQGWVTALLARADRFDGYWSAAAPGSPERAVLALARLAHRRLEERLGQQGAVDFDRMIAWTRDLLDDAAVREALRRRIRVLVIDEFQDTDPLQKEIAYRLADPGSRRPDTTRLVLVGDPKQSIYRFRRADVTVWNAVAEDFEGRGWGRVLPLADNRRSFAGILAFVDATIGQALAQPVHGEALQPFEVGPQPLTAVRGNPDDVAEAGGVAAAGDGAGSGDAADVGTAAAAAPVVELLLTPADKGLLRRAEGGRRIDAEGVARRMRALHDEEHYDWRDIALLLASWSDVDLWENALRGQKIPCYVLQSDGFYGRTEVRDLIVALEAVRDPNDDRALFGFLRSPFVGVSDETLLSVATQLRTPYWRGLEKVTTGEDELLRRGVDLLRRYGELRDRVPVAALTEALLEDSGYLAHLALLLEDGEQSIANVRRFLDLARAAPEATLGDVLRRIAEERARGDRVAQARLHGEKDDVVLISSIHSAKGLEWRAVFWADLGRAPPVDYRSRLQIGRDTILLGDPELKYDQQSEPWQALWRREQDERRAEHKRLWYVAATRARDLLVLSGLALGEGKRASGCPAEMIMSTLAPDDAGRVEYRDGGGRTYVARVQVLGPEVVAAAEAAAKVRLEEKPVGDPARLARPPVPVPAPFGRGRHSATEVMLFERCPRRHWYRYVAGIKEPSAAAAGPAWQGATVRGQLVHDVLEHLEEEEDVEWLLEDAIERLAPDAPAEDLPAGGRYRAALRAEIERVAGHPQYRALADEPGARRELAFLLVLDEGRYLEGFFDLAAPGEDGLRILDVKTGDTPPAEAVAKYAPQRDVYVSAAAHIAGLPVRHFLWAFSRPGKVIDALLGPGEPVEARQRVRRAIEAMERGDRAPAADSSTCWRCGYRAVGLCPGSAKHGGGPGSGTG